MNGHDLSCGKYKKTTASEDELWRYFNKIFSKKTANSSTYKFVFLKALLDCISKYNKHKYTFYNLFESFTDIYWTLVIKYNLKQSNLTKSETCIEQILKRFILSEHDSISNNAKFYDLPEDVRKNIIYQVKSKCKTYVVGALYGDTEGIIYSFSKKDEIIELNPVIFKFLKKHKQAIEELNYYELAKFIDKVNSKTTADKIATALNYRKENSIEIYRQLIYSEFKKTSNSTYECASHKSYNTIELLFDANLQENSNNGLEEDLSQNDILDNETITDIDLENMKKYLDDPEKIIKIFQQKRLTKK